MSGSYAPDRRVVRRGFTLIEMLIAITISLIILAVLVEAFSRASNVIRDNRAAIELASQLRSVGELMRHDLANCTVSPKVWTLTAQCDGYFEIVEGPESDNSYPALGTAENAFIGDVDDILALTVRSDERPFRGRWIDPTGVTHMVESNLAEVVWFTVLDNLDDTDNLIDRDDRVRLYRRVLLIRPDLTLTPAATLDQFYRTNDISAYPQAGKMIANTLDDLTRRERRYCHSAAAYPYELRRDWLAARRLHQTNPGDTVGADLNGEDIVLTDVCGFDLRVYSPNAPILSDGLFVLEPNDANFIFNPNLPPEGAYVDLGWADASRPPAAVVELVLGVPRSKKQIRTAIYNR